MKIDEFKRFARGKNASVIGLGISNIPLTRFLLSCGMSVTVRDKKSRGELGGAADELETLGAKFILGENYLDGINDDLVFRSPGIRPDIPELKAAAERGGALSSEMELFFELCPCPIMAITGSDGKTTTTTVTSLILKKEFELSGSKRRVFLGGNIGTPLIDKVEEMRTDDIAVIELSSFQLQTMKTSPDTAAVTNVTPNHLNWHTGMDEYIAAKANIFLHQKPSGRVVLNYENEITRNYAKKAVSNVCFFSSKRVPDSESAVYEKDGTIYLKYNGKESAVIKTSDIKIPGRHNVENYMTAIGLTAGLVSKEAVYDIAKNFNGVEHRLEFVRELNGVKYYNGSIDSSPTRTVAALSCFKCPVVVILGGYDKNLDYEPLCGPLFEHARAAVLTGQNAEKIYRSMCEYGIPDGFTVIKEPDFIKAVYEAVNAALPGDCVILSPAAASFDRFKNFEERGKLFKATVNSL